MTSMDLFVDLMRVYELPQDQIGRSKAVRLSTMDTEMQNVIGCRADDSCNTT